MSSHASVNWLKPILIGGLIAGTLDMTAACVSAWLRSRTTPFRVAQFIASGAQGQAALSGGNKSALLGLAFHFLIATVATAVFYLASRKLRFLIRWPIPMGLVYGVLVYLFMNFVVLPRSAITLRGTPTLSSRVIQALIIMFCVGLPIALIVRWYSKPNNARLVLSDSIEADSV
ncbi:MAG TPA: hypothetical protein VFI57_12475 [Pyrinomonadaceae bacterium]|nr:hypothetical protein [Pyrinomonadaceae bacterium]